MVHFEKDKLVLEIPVGDPFYEYLQMLNALMTLGWFVSEHPDDESVGKAFGILAFYFGKALSEMEHDKKLTIDNHLRNSEVAVEQLSSGVDKQE